MFRLTDVLVFLCYSFWCYLTAIKHFTQATFRITKPHCCQNNKDRSTWLNTCVILKASFLPEWTNECVYSSTVCVARGHALRKHSRLTECLLRRFTHHSRSLEKHSQNTRRHCYIFCWQAAEQLSSNVACVMDWNCRLFICSGNRAVQPWRQFVCQPGKN